MEKKKFLEKVLDEILAILAVLLTFILVKLGVKDWQYFHGLMIIPYMIAILYILSLIKGLFVKLVTLKGDIDKKYLHYWIWPIRLGIAILIINMPH